MELMTQHAEIRMQQRGIEENTLDCLFEFGAIFIVSLEINL